MSTATAPGREDMLARLRQARPLLDSFGVAHVSLFGSFACDEAREDSDVDVLIEFARGRSDCSTSYGFSASWVSGSDETSSS